MNRYIAKNLVYHPIQYLRGQRVKEYLTQVKKTQFMPLEEMNKLRDEKLKKIINYAYHTIPYYRKEFDDLGILPEEIKGFEDLTILPVLSKREVLENKKSLTNPTIHQKLYTRTTSGSTGINLQLKKEAKALALNDAIMYRCYDWYGIDIGDKQVRFWGVPLTRILRWKEQIKDFILNRIRISVFDLSKTSCIKQYEKIKKFRPAYFYGYTSAICEFSRIMKESGIDLNTLNLKAVICTAEKMYPHHKKLLDEIFSCPIVDEYGSSEIGIIAFQCRERNTHMMNDHLCIELLDEKNKRVKPGEQGRIVITELSSYAMPMIRYDIGDIGRPSEKKCTCGINLPLMEMVEGRKIDLIKTTEGKCVHANLLLYTLKDTAVHEYKMYQKAINKIHVQIVKSPLYTTESEKTLENKLRTVLGQEVKITFEYLGVIPRELSGKLRFFVSELQSTV